MKQRETSGNSVQHGATDRPAITWAAFADVIDAATLDGHRESYFVIHACGSAGAFGKSYYCATHDQQLANLGNLEMHLAPGGEHHLVVWCRRHRTYEEPEPADVTAIRQATFALERHAP